MRAACILRVQEPDHSAPDFGHYYLSSLHYFDIVVPWLSVYNTILDEYRKSEFTSILGTPTNNHRIGKTSPAPTFRIGFSHLLLHSSNYDHVNHFRPEDLQSLVNITIEYTPHQSCFIREGTSTFKNSTRRPPISCRRYHEQTKLATKNEQARLHNEAAVIESAKPEVLQAQINLEAREDAAEKVEKANSRRSNGLRQRELTQKLTLNSAIALNETVNNNLAVVKQELDEDKQVNAVILEKHRNEAVEGLNDEITALSTTLEKQAPEASGISKERKAVEKDLESILTTTKRQLVGISTKVSSGLEEVSSKIDNVTKRREEEEEEEEEEEAKKEEDEKKEKRKNLAKRGLEPASPEEPISKRRRHARQSSVGSAEMLTSVGRLEPLPANILDTVRSPRGQGRVTMVTKLWRADDSSPTRRRPAQTSGTARTPSGGHGLLRSSVGTQSALHSQPSSSIDPATATGERSSQSAMIPSSQSGPSGTDLADVSEVSEEEALELVLMPKKLIDQWMTQVKLVAPGFLTIYKYHGDARRHEPIVGEKAIQGRLNTRCLMNVSSSEDRDFTKGSRG
ncbi:hypothetical protein JMJ35_005918 [Cladonia borealis]|uniref:Uncharacterized protein n=1 Tax=Cladonia borealis TaxID=184061 RepID=A0AA39QY65_9LECA|nr:hypothetical protein JMJ35_005918 [Cladonia borealis]